MSIIFNAVHTSRMLTRCLLRRVQCVHRLARVDVSNGSRPADAVVEVKEDVSPLPPLRIPSAEWEMVDPLEGPSGMPPSESLVAELRSLYFDEDKETALEKAKDGGREAGEGRFRSIVYSEGELDRSDLSKPPSRLNPHPFDPSSLPPTHSRSLVPYANHVPLLRILVDIGVDLFEVETKNPLVPRHLLRLPLEEAKVKIRWLVSIGFTPDSLGDYLTRNPFLLLQNLDDMKARINFLTSCKFTRSQIVKLVSEFRFWLNLDVETTQQRMEWLTGTFGLRKSLMRAVLVKEPRMFMFGTGPIKRIWDLLTTELGFSAAQVKEMLLEDPRLFIMDSRVITANFVYLSKVMGVEGEAMAACPFVLRVGLSSLRSRHEFLRSLGRAKYSDLPEKKKDDRRAHDKPQEIVPLPLLLLPTDAEFAEKAARVRKEAYDIFLRNH